MEIVRPVVGLPGELLFVQNLTGLTMQNVNRGMCVDNDPDWECSRRDLSGLSTTISRYHLNKSGCGGVWLGGGPRQHPPKN
ncbi:MAG: hypothetical protein AB1649_17030, partial [Chloroflexota bacterium]